MKPKVFPYSKVESIVHSAIEMDQIILLETELLSNNLGNLDSKRLANIKNRARKNGELLQQLHDLVTDHQEKILVQK